MRIDKNKERQYCKFESYFATLVNRRKSSGRYYANSEIDKTSVKHFFLILNAQITLQRMHGLVPSGFAKPFP